ncbi:hypothetical protein [Porphyrobacter sp. LM 6]|uniref:hypothetical protein n=1 Tax=Porphyrobacter sp. LM 6 TaxID=1896196 RepID=UPI0008462C83|nr:hypothetical protein [Porphyrobacter sp. LM 6]AOL93614.1 hypothetical protein BG023_11661 [Porphyrobacter sp. LM 6]
MADKHSDNPPQDAAGSDRRSTDRRKQQLPFEGPDRRKGDRRSGEDRRAAPRIDGTVESGE